MCPGLSRSPRRRGGPALLGSGKSILEFISRDDYSHFLNQDSGFRGAFAVVTSRKHSAAEHTGTQSIERALRILRELAARGEFGWRLSDLAARFLVDDERQEIARRGDARLDALEKMRERSRRHRFGVNLGGVAPGVHAFALPLRAAAGLSGVETVQHVKLRRETRMGGSVVPGYARPAAREASALARLRALS
jgi:hypothetical protein